MQIRTDRPEVSLLHSVEITIVSPGTSTSSTSSWFLRSRKILCYPLHHSFRISKSLKNFVLTVNSWLVKLLSVLTGPISLCRRVWPLEQCWAKLIWVLINRQKISPVPNFKNTMVKPPISDAGHSTWFDARYTTAIGMTGEPVAPLNFTGSKMKLCVDTPSRTIFSVTRFSTK